jgi:glycosyltransferase involved in cell wall biosynthesis
MKILFDADIFARCYKNKKIKSGIFYSYKAIVSNVLSRNGIEVALASFSNSPKHAKIILREYDIKTNIINCQNKALTMINKIKLICKDIRTLKKKKLSINAPIFVIARIFLLTLVSILQIINIFRRNKKDHYTISKYDYFISYNETIPDIIKKNKNIKKVVILHDMIPYLFPKETSVIKSKSKIFKTRKKFLKKIRSLDEEVVIICNSNNTAKDLTDVEPKFKRRNVVIAPFAYDSKQFFPLKASNVKSKTIEVQKKYKIPTDKSYLLSLCSLSPRKNIDFLIKAFDIFINKHDFHNKINLVLSGSEAWQTGDIFKEYESCKARKNIVFTGFIDDEDINYLYNGSDCFVYPSKYEGFGLPILEAMACNLPVITSNNSSMVEVAGDGALLINPNDTGSLVSAFEKYFLEDSCREKLIEHSKSNIKKFSWDKTCDIILQSLTNK